MNRIDRSSRITGCTWPTILGLLAMVGVSGGCGQTGSPDAARTETTASKQDRPLVSSATYRLEWAWGKARAAADGRGWTVTTDRGWRVTLDRGRISTYSVELVPCKSAPTTSTHRSGLGWLDLRLPPLFSSGVAYAGHSNVHDPSALKRPQVEGLEAPQALQLEGLSFPAASYCQVHYLIARAGFNAAGNPDGNPDGNSDSAPTTTPDLTPPIDMTRTSVHLEGRYKSVDGSSSVPFVIHTSIANGRLADVAPPAASSQIGLPTPQPSPAAGSTPPKRLELVVRRDLGTLFDGLDFPTAKEATLARQVLKNLIDGTSIETHWKDQP